MSTYDRDLYREMGIIEPPVEKKLRRGSSKPERWNRSTRWHAAMARVPKPPEGADSHLARTFSYVYAQVMTGGWDYCRQHPKQSPQWYVQTAYWLMAEFVRSHIAACPHPSCTRSGWAWFFDTTDKTPPPTLPSVEGEL